jgi:hypothetical protein
MLYCFRIWLKPRNFIVCHPEHPQDGGICLIVYLVDSSSVRAVVYCYFILIGRTSLGMTANFIRFLNPGIFNAGWLIYA